ncbi:ANTAR domain-containing protein [Streptomyces griseorubiginosus]|uniref:ANTAR domain-containing protein n=1 Tax=Streptomyces griseorubiginosus TaxID=67304 RepID=UPI001AD7B498|nr:ANTAR domain-containing protein [Streptomyces griseorubiginosus]MBO4254688.1 GAF domain-containing protein [Streptomyces griseorubiginosus]
MATEGGATQGKISAERKAAVARARSAHETIRAERCEAQAAEAPTEALRAAHLRMAELHRSTAHCHLTAARLQDDYASRLALWAGQRGTPRPRFMTGVAEACGTSSAALTLVGADSPDELTVAASDESARAAQELEFLLGEGPARDATVEVRPVMAAGPGLAVRWPGYGPAVTELGIDEVAAVPLSLAGVCVGALAVFDPAPGFVGTDSFTEIAEALTRSMILSPDGDAGLYGAAELRAKVHQAAGMVSVQLECPVADALELIKARAFAEGVSARSVAERVLDGELRLG